LFDPTVLSGVGTPRVSTDPTFIYNKAICLGNGFAALHPSLKFLAPVYAAGDLAIIHRVAYPKQSRSHFDSQDYWENGNPNNKLVKDGIFYRAMLESGLAATQPLTGVSIQSALPVLLRGTQIPMTNLTDPLRYDLLGVPNNTDGNLKASRALTEANSFPFASKLNRDLLDLQYRNMQQTLDIFAGLGFDETSNTFTDDINTDASTKAYNLFPTDANNTKNGGGTTATNVVDASSSSRALFTNIKAAAIILNRTDAIVAGTEYGGFDTHNNQGAAVGPHANLMSRLGWAIYALRKYFTLYGKGGPRQAPGAKVGWNDIVIVTMSEFGRTTIQNSSFGTDHAEAGVMFVAGGGVNGGTYGCSPGDGVPWVPGPANQAGGVDGSMFGVSDRYLKRVYDFRSVLGRIIRNHLGATQAQLDRIIPGYADSREKLNTTVPAVNTIDNTPVLGEPPIV
jgi:uncharacterized protein (DUF1501 family)